MSAPSTSGLSVELLLRVIDVKYGYFTLLQSHISSNRGTNSRPSVNRLPCIIAPFGLLFEEIHVRYDL